MTNLDNLSPSAAQYVSFFATFGQGTWVPLPMDFCTINSGSSDARAGWSKACSERLGR